MSAKNRLFFVLISFFGLHVLVGQEVNHQFHFLTIDEGLAHTDATCITQDDQSFIWIGTYFGLNRFDGYELKSFYNQNNPLRNVYTNRINDFCIDHKRRIWLATQGGVECFDIATASFLELKRGDDPTLNTAGSVISFDTTAGKLIIGDAIGLTFFSVTADLQLETIAPTIPVGVGAVHGLVKGRKDWWVIGSEGLFRVKLGHTPPTIEKILLRDAAGQEIKNLSAITFDENQLWLATNTHIYTATIQDQSEWKALNHPFVSSTHKINTFTDISLKKHQDILWIGTESGLMKCRISPEGLVPKLYQKKEPFTKYALTSSHISDLFIDQSNCLWLSTFGGGVNYIDLSQKKFHLLQHDSQDPQNSLSGNYIRAMLEDPQGNLWIGTRENGLNHYNFKTGQYQHFIYQENQPQGISSDKIRSIAYDQQARLWVGTQEGLNIYKGNGQNFDKLFFQSDNPNSISNDVIFALACDKFGQMWAGSWHNGLNRIVYNSQQDYQIERINSQTSPWKLSSDKVSFIYADDQNAALFVGTDNGLNHIFLNETGHITNIIYYKGEGEANQLSSNFIWPIIKTAPDTLWVGTIGGGLNKIVLLPNGQYEARRFSVAEGIPSIDIESILEDESGNLWLGSRGLSMFNPTTETFTHYDINDGLQSNSFKIGAAAKGKNGKLYFGGTNGINFFYPKEIRQYQQKPSIVLTDLVVNNEPVQLKEAKNKWVLLERSINLTTDIRLSHLENNFSLTFAAIHFANPDKCRYRYKLDGFDDDWIYTDANNRKATYSNLDYGKYVFHVAGSNSDGVWSEEEVNLNIAIVAPWWSSTLARVIYFLFILGVLAGIFYYTTRWYKLKSAYEFTLLEEQQMEELHKMRLQFFTNISHEFKTPLTLILNPLEQLSKGDIGKRKQRRYYQIMENNARRLLNLVNELLDFRKIESNAYSLHAEKMDLSSFAEDIFENFREHALLRDIEFSFRSEGLIDHFWMDKNVVEKILINLLGNAFKYTDVGGNISLEVYEHYEKIKPHFAHSFKIDQGYQAKAYVWIKVADNGVGIPANLLHLIFDRYFSGEEFSHDEKKGTGVGLALVKSLVARHSGLLQVFSEEGRGAAFLVGLPKGKEHLHEGEIVTQSVYKRADYDLPKLKDLYPESYQTTDNEAVNETRKKTLLIVEDNLELRHFLKEHFEETYHLLEANNGKEGLHILKKHQPDIILSDVMMPQMDGIEFCKLVKGDDAYNHIPFILLTAKSAIENRIEGMQSGADIYLAKPFSIDELQLTLRNILISRMQLRQLYLKNAFSEAREIAVVEKEKEFMDEMVRLVEEHLEDTDFDVDALCKAMGMSRTKLYSKVKAVTDKSIGEFIRGMRLRKAAQMLASEEVSVAEVMYKVGIQSQSYFTKSFKKEFGKTPSRYVKEL